jgi:hypothetical protein
VKKFNSKYEKVTPWLIKKLLIFEVGRENIYIRNCSLFKKVSH